MNLLNITKRQISTLEKLVSENDGKVTQTSTSTFASVKAKDGTVLCAGIGYSQAKMQQTFFYTDSETIHFIDSLQNAVSVVTGLLEIRNA